jgi:hypothetical protein
MPLAVVTKWLSLVFIGLGLFARFLAYILYIYTYYLNFSHSFRFVHGLSQFLSNMFPVISHRQSLVSDIHIRVAVVILIWFVQWFRLTISKGPNRVGVSASHPRTETDPVSGTLYPREFRKRDDSKVQKPSNSDDSMWLRKILVDHGWRPKTTQSILQINSKCTNKFLVKLGLLAVWWFCKWISEWICDLMDEHTRNPTKQWTKPTTSATSTVQTQFASHTYGLFVDADKSTDCRESNDIIACRPVTR